ncbi:Hypothetical predicted protein, partial [Marmota monax]
TQLESPDRGSCDSKPAGIRAPGPGWCPKMGAATCNQTWSLPRSSPLGCGSSTSDGGCSSCVGFRCIQGTGAFCGSSTQQEDLQWTSGWQQRNQRQQPWQWWCRWPRDILI